MNYTPLSPARYRSRLPLGQITSQLWASTVGLLIGTAGILVTCIEGQHHEVTGWATQVNTILAVFDTILKGSLGSVICTALYQSMWENVARQGMSVKQMYAYSQAARLAIGSLTHPIMKFVWLAGIVGIILTSGSGPLLQASVHQVSSQRLEPTSLTTFHTGLNGTLATTLGAFDYPIGPISQVSLAAIDAFVGQQNLFRYLSEPVTGDSVFGPLQYADVNCTITSAPGGVDNAILLDDYWYNFTVTNYNTPFESATSAANYYTRVDFTAVLNNGSYFLYHTCSIRPVIGYCGCYLSNGTANYSSLTCEATEDFVIPDYSGVDLRDTTANGFVAISQAFITLFKGTIYDDISGDPQLNTTFSALGSYEGRSFIQLPDLVPQMQRTIWNIPFAVANVQIQDAQV